MNSQKSHRRTVENSERAAALAAIATARAKHKHAGIRPRQKESEGKRTSGILISPQGNPGSMLNEALSNAEQAWPDNNCWQIFGADGFEDFPDDDSCDEIGDGYFENPAVYGEFTTGDEPAWLGGYPV